MADELVHFFGLMLSFGAVCFMLGRCYEEWRSSGYQTWLDALRAHVERGEQILRDMLKDGRS